MTDFQQLRKQIDEAANVEDPLDRRLRVIAVITRALADTGIKPVIVGGAAVEFYTSGGYTTFDIDLVCDSFALDAVLIELGFSREGRHWFREDLAIAIEAPASSLTSHEREHVLQANVDGQPVYLIGLEDVIIDRLNAFVHWKSGEDGRWATHLIADNHDQVDWEYLRRRAVEERCEAALDEILTDLDIQQ